MIELETIARELVAALEKKDAADIELYHKKLADHLIQIDADRGEFAADIQAARDEHANDDLEIDDEPLVARSDNGTWVNAWVYVASEDAADPLDD